MTIEGYMMWSLLKNWSYFFAQPIDFGKTFLIVHHVQMEVFDDL